MNCSHTTDFKNKAFTGYKIKDVVIYFSFLKSINRLNLTYLLELFKFQQNGKALHSSGQSPKFQGQGTNGGVIMLLQWLLPNYRMLYPSFYAKSQLKTNIFRMLKRWRVGIEPRQHRSGLCLVHTTLLSKLSGRRAVHTTWLSVIWSGVFTLHDSPWCCRLLYSVPKQPFVSKTNARNHTGNVWTQCVGWGFSSQTWTQRGKEPSSFVCYNVVKEQKKEEEHGWRNTWGCCSALLHFAATPVSALVGCRRRGEQKPVGNQPIGLKSCNVNKALGTTLNVLRWPGHQNRMSRTQSNTPGEIWNHPFDLKELQRIWEKECQTIPKSKCKFGTSNPRRPEAVIVA